MCFVLQAIGEQLGLLHADRVERRVAVAVDGAGTGDRVRGRRLAVPHEQQRRRARAAA